MFEDGSPYLPPPSGYKKGPSRQSQELLAAIPAMLEGAPPAAGPIAHKFPARAAGMGAGRAVGHAAASGARPGTAGSHGRPKHSSSNPNLAHPRPSSASLQRGGAAAPAKPAAPLFYLGLAGNEVLGAEAGE